MNKVILIGRLVKDPELRRTNTDIPVVQFSLAVNRRFLSGSGERQADFINCVVWRNQAENLARYMRKGNQIAVEGRLQVRNYEDAGGVRRYVTEVICDQIMFLEPRGSRSGEFGDINTYDIPPRQSGGYQESGSGTVTEAKDPFEDLKLSSGVSDDDLPF